MTTYRIHCRARTVEATERDRWPQPDGSRVPTAELTTAHHLPGAGRVLRVVRVRVEEVAA